LALLPADQLSNPPQSWSVARETSRQVSISLRKVASFASGHGVPEADPVALAHLLTAVFQGGALLDQAAGEPTPLRDALYGALAYIESFAARS